MFSLVKYSQKKGTRVVLKLVFGTIDTRRYFCPLFKQKVGQELCQGQSVVIPKNVHVCCITRCESPWRFCVPCLQEGHKGEDNLVTHLDSGLCDFHHSGETKARQRAKIQLNFKEVKNRWMEALREARVAKEEIEIRVDEEKSTISSDDIETPGMSDWSLVDIAERIEEMLAEGKAWEEITLAFHRSISWVQTHRSLLKLDPSILDLLKPTVPPNKRLRTSMAFALVTLPTYDLQRQALVHIQREKLTVGQAREWIQMWKEKNQ